MKRSRRLGIAALGLTFGLALALGGGQCAGLRLNFTDSAPKGLWWVASGEVNLERGQWVELCPPSLPVVQQMLEHEYLASGSCADSGSIPLLKPVAGLAGDYIQLASDADVRLNGQALPNTRALAHLPPWPIGEYRVQTNEVWLFSSHSPSSFDSRYFGPVALVRVRGLARPLWVWP